MQSPFKRPREGWPTLIGFEALAWVVTFALFYFYIDDTVSRVSRIALASTASTGFTLFVWLGAYLAERRVNRMPEDP